jgi:hypothetical protein
MLPIPLIHRPLSTKGIIRAREQMTDEETKSKESRGTVPLNSKLAGSGMSSLGRYVFGSEISYNKAPPRLPGLGC